MKTTVKNPLSYTYDAARRGAKYTVDGIHFMNAGEFLEAAAKAVFGLDPRKDANTRFDKGSDVPEFNASVKSSRASLTTEKLAATLEESIEVYFRRVASTEFWYVTMLDDEVSVYRMNAETFRQFVTKFGKLNERGVIRLASTSAKVLAWLESNVQ